MDICFVLTILWQRCLTNPTRDCSISYIWVFKCIWRYKDTSLESGREVQAEDLHDEVVCRSTQSCEITPRKEVKRKEKMSEKRGVSQHLQIGKMRGKTKWTENEQRVGSQELCCEKTPSAAKRKCIVGSGGSEERKTS